MTRFRLIGGLLGLLVLLVASHSDSLTGKVAAGRTAAVPRRTGGVEPSPSSLAVALATGEPPPLPGICSESDRFGAAVARHRIDSYDVGQLYAGWYTNFAATANPPHPVGMSFVQVIRISDDGPFENQACSACPSWEMVSTIAQLNPGSLWFIGNEPDRQDYVEADRYAELYHDFYTFLKVEDPTCHVGVGGVVQPTPIRLQYLDLILDAYQVRYGAAMPVNVWNVHNYVLREGATGWGCGIPPGTDPDLAIEYSIQDHDDVNAWTWHLRLMRQWMRDRGYQDRPLIITEYGILMPEMYGYDYPRVRDFMLATYDWMMTAADPDTGYPADGNRLVQAWAWYSLDDPAFEGWPSWNHLFDPDTLSITSLGLDFGGYTAPLTAPFPGSIDLQPTAIRHTRPEPAGGSFVTMTVMTDIYNGGAETAENVLVRFERDSVQAGEVIIPSIAAGERERASVVWPNLPFGQLLQATVTVDPAAQIVECDPFNNSLSVPLLVADWWTYLPLIVR